MINFIKEQEYKTIKTIEKQSREIERLKEELNDEIDDGLKQSEIMLKQHNEIERLNDIIKEAREYNEHLIRDAKYHLNEGHLKKMKKLLDKVGETNVKD